MIRVFTTRTFDKLFEKLEKRVQIKAVEKTKIFKINPFDRILKTEKLHPKRYDIWSFRVDINYRIVFRFIGKDKVLFMFIGHHNQIYRYDLFGK